MSLTFTKNKLCIIIREAGTIKVIISRPTYEEIRTMPAEELPRFLDLQTLTENYFLEEEQVKELMKLRLAGEVLPHEDSFE